MKLKRLHILFLLLSLLICGQSFLGFEIGNPNHQLVQKHQKKATNYFSQDDLTLVDDWDSESENKETESQKNFTQAHFSFQHFLQKFCSNLFEEKNQHQGFSQPKIHSFSIIYLLFRSIRI